MKLESLPQKSRLLIMSSAFCSLPLLPFSVESQTGLDNTQGSASKPDVFEIGYNSRP